jgi:hypothetical protein
MSSDTNYCLKGPQGNIVGFRLGAEELGHEIYDILDWADEHFSSHVVKQTDGCVYVYSETAREKLSGDEVHAEPLSIESGDQDDRSGSGPMPGGPSGGGPSGGSGGGGPGGGGGSGGNAPAGTAGGGGKTIESAGL